MVAIELSGLSKKYGTVTALDALDIEIGEGTVYALVGPNGSGKSTMLNILLGLVRPTSGTATLHGHDVVEEPLAVRRQLGVVPEGYGVYDRLSGRRHVKFAAESRGVDVDPAAVLGRVGLADVADRRAATYSRGMAKRLILALATVGKPDVLLLDEPFNGLDPTASEMLRKTIREERDRGATVLFTTHLFREVRAVADQVGMLADGQLIREERIEDIAAGTPAVETIEAAYRQAVNAEVVP